MRKSDWLPVYENYKPFYEDAARTHYEGDTEAGFKFWAVSQILMDQGLSDDEIKAPLLIDRDNDLGIDGFYEDEEDNVVTLIQSRYHGVATPIGNTELNTFFSCLKNLLNPRIVTAAADRNPLVNDAHRVIRTAISKGWTIRFIFVTSGYLSSPGGKQYVSEHREETEILDEMTISKELLVLDIENLDKLYRSHLVPERLNTDVDLIVDPKDIHESILHSEIGDYNYLLAALPGRELVKAFRLHGYALFKLNPRGPLQNKVNNEIKRTIRDPIKNQLFFHLNNGITAICDSFTVSKDRIAIRDFQIVNGCQTTVTLVKMEPIVESSGGIKVLLRLFEGVRNIRSDIANATNTQARLTAREQKSNDPLQNDLHNRFNALPTPIFYEVKRGDWEMEGKKDRYKVNRQRTHRRVNMVDVAQATLAFLGEPGIAKDRSRDIFENEEVYKRVFPDNIKPEQLLLPWKTYLIANDLCEAWKENFPGAQYARYYLVAIVGSEFAPDKKIPPIKQAIKLRQDKDTIGPIMRIGQAAIISLISAMGDNYPGHREFFRSAEFFIKVLNLYKGLPKG